MDQVWLIILYLLSLSQIRSVLCMSFGFGFFHFLRRRRFSFSLGYPCSHSLRMTMRLEMLLGKGKGLLLTVEEILSFRPKRTAAMRSFRLEAVCDIEPGMGDSWRCIIR